MSISQILREQKEKRGGGPSYGAYIQGHAPPEAYQKRQQMPQYAVNAPPPPPPDETITKLSSERERKEKDKYVIGETKEEIVTNIIEKKASVANVKKALAKYAELIMEEDLF
jgi:hypothetical protein